MSRPLRVLTFTTLYPNGEQPRHGIFIEHRLRQLLSYADGGVTAQVVAPVAWFPFRSKLFGRYGVVARVAGREERRGIVVEHPRYAVIPKIGMALAPDFLVAGADATLNRILREGFEFDVIDAHFLYPDGVAAVELGRRLNKPVLLTARGTDVHSYREIPSVWRRTLRAIDASLHVVTVSEALRRALCASGVSEERVTTLRNGVDLELFRPVPRDRVRRELNLHRTTLLSVGNLVAVKGHDLVIRALVDLPGVELVIIGHGPEENRLRLLAQQSGVSDRVRILPVMTQPELCRWYSAADALMLASSREGWPNVLLESMACGTPVIATSVWGVPEVVTAPEAGRLVTERSSTALAQACRDLLANPPAARDVRAYAERFDWRETSARLLDLLERRA